MTASMVLVSMPMLVAGGMVAGAGAGVGVTFKATICLLLQAVAPVPSVMMFGGFMMVPPGHHLDHARQDPSPSLGMKSA